MKQNSVIVHALSVCGLFLASGICNTLTVQLIYDNVHFDPKTMFTNLCIFVGYLMLRFIPSNLSGEPTTSHNHRKWKPASSVPRSRYFALAVFDCIASLCTTIGQIAIGSGIIFGALLSKFVLKKHLSTGKWLSILTIVVGLCICVYKPSHPSTTTIDTPTDQYSNLRSFVGVLFVLFAAFVFSASNIFSEYVIKEYEVSPFQFASRYGYYSVMCVLTYIGTATFYNRKEWVIEPILESQSSGFYIFVLFAILSLGSVFRSSSVFTLLSTYGTVTVGVLYAIQSIVVFGTSAIFLCDPLDPIRKVQCITTPKLLGSIIVIIGGLWYTMAAVTSSSSSSSTSTTSSPPSSSSPILNSKPTDSNDRKIVSYTTTTILVVCVFIIIQSSYLTLVLANTDEPCKIGKIQNTISKLYQLIEDSQIKESTSFNLTKDKLTWQELKGLFPSDIHHNICGNPNKTQARRSIKISDPNMFSEKLGSIKISNDVLESGTEAILYFRDQNRLNGSGVYTFWPQIYEPNTKTYFSLPVNLGQLTMATNGSLEKVFETVAKMTVPSIPFSDDVTIITETPSQGGSDMAIPADTDDTSVNIALGYLLSTVQHSHPKVHQTWQSANPNISNVIASYVHYSYVPFSKSPDTNTIDPRTYYMMHEFLQSLTTANDTDKQQSFILPTTWMMTLADQRKTSPYFHISFNMNNIDLSVALNALFGIASATRQYIVENNNNSCPPFFTQDIANICTSIADIVSWSIKSGRAFNRADIALVYYPSIYDYGWFASRIVSLLEEFEHPLYPSALEYAHDILLDALQQDVTDRLYHHVKLEIVEKKMYYFWDGFLGSQDTGASGNPLHNGDDRFMTTSIAVLTLIDTWTTTRSTSTSPQLTYHWRPNTPSTVKSLVKSAVEYISDRVLIDKEYTFNAFFSGSHKGSSSNFYSYPVNTCQYLNGTQCNPHIHNRPLSTIQGVSGVVDKDIYQEMVYHQTWDNTTTPTSWAGTYPDTFLFWSSTPLTYSFCLHALSKALNIN
ncbi:hypothetical protein DFA_05432 [Cavenderia fasciculata]|uniref:Uncharacterized protein n=1 Tax=Cavenderia fasciculata TaxID=261658 RepID=F4PL78_CACFS|nr:uncharacterized protein DFA_05432 [Cavenderia fasciculata]EGG23300.1 hypothetical protein DFA_05432 [Cavenderia fasciculata]|eukprot:XP_004361151.1 hypothetical protein DFA_05432 [Cavenderia fasciculata]